MSKLSSAAALAAGLGAAARDAVAAFAAGAAAATGAAAAAGASSVVPSTTMAVPQCLHVIFTFLPRTFSSGIPYLAEQDVQLTFMKFLGTTRAWLKSKAC